MRESISKEKGVLEQPAAHCWTSSLPVWDTIWGSQKGLIQHNMVEEGQIKLLVNWSENFAFFLCWDPSDRFCSSK